MTRIVGQSVRQLVLRVVTNSLPGRRFLRRADLDDEVAAWDQVALRFSANALENPVTIRPAIEGEVRLVVAHTGRQPRDLALGDIGRVAEDEVKLLAGRQRLEQVSLH